MPRFRKRKVQVTESTKTNGSKKLKSGKIQKCSSSSEFELDDETIKNKTSPKKRTIERKNLPKKHLNTTRTSSIIESTSEDRNLGANGGTEQSKENGSKNLGTNHSSDSDEPPLVIDEDSNDDFKGLQNDMKENVTFLNLIASKSKCDIPDIKYNSEDKSPQKNDEQPKNDEDVEIKKKLYEYLKDDTSESDFDVPGTQETIKTINHIKDVKTKIDVNKISNVTSSESESDHEEKKQTIITGNIRKDETSNRSPMKNSNADTSESDSDIEGTQETVNAADGVKDVKTKIEVRKKLNLVVCKSESGSEEKPKSLNVKNFKTDVKSMKSVNKNSNAVSSESESGIERSQKAVKRRKILNKDAETQKDANKISLAITTESESEQEEKHKTINTQKDANKISQAISSESESDQEEKHKTINTSNCTKNENIKIDVEKQSNMSTAETEIGEEVTKGLKNTCNKPIINYDLQMLSELKEKKCSDSSDFEFSLENSSLHEEKEQESSDTSKTKMSNVAVEKRSKVFGKKKFGTHRKINSPPPEVKQELQEVSSEDSAQEEDLNESCASWNYTRYKPTEEEREKLVNMQVKIRYPVVHQHTIESTAGTRTLNENEREEFEKYATLKHGKFSPEEDKQIKINWKTFCLDNNWDPKNPRPFLFMKHKNKVFYLNQRSRRKFMQCLAHGLPDRCLYSVFQRFKILFEPHRTCRYDSDEDRKILDYVAVCELKKTEDKEKDVNEKDRKFAELAIILRRTRASVWRRYRVLRKKAGKESKDDFCHSSK